MRIDGDRIAPVDAVEQPPTLIPKDEETTVRRVDVMPEAEAFGHVREVV